MKSGNDGGSAPIFNWMGIVFPEYSTEPTVPKGTVKFKSERL
jgi:hypothetical protein